jgi:hypothetical protein
VKGSLTYAFAREKVRTKKMDDIMTRDVNDGRRRRRRRSLISQETFNGFAASSCSDVLRGHHNVDVDPLQYYLLYCTYVVL